MHVFDLSNSHHIIGTNSDTVRHARSCLVADVLQPFSPDESSDLKDASGFSFI